MMNDGLMGIRHRGTRLEGSSTGVKISSGDLEERSAVYGESDPTPPLSISIADTQPHLLESVACLLPGGGEIVISTAIHSAKTTAAATTATASRRFPTSGRKSGVATHSCCTVGSRNQGEQS